MVCKYVFTIKNKYITKYLSTFLSIKFNKHFSDMFYDLIMHKINAFNISLKKKSHTNTNS